MACTHTDTHTLSLLPSQFLDLGTAWAVTRILYMDCDRVPFANGARSIYYPLLSQIVCLPVCQRIACVLASHITLGCAGWLAGCLFVFTGCQPGDGLVNLPFEEHAPRLEMDPGKKFK